MLFLLHFLMLGDTGGTYSTLLSLKPLVQQLSMIPDWPHSVLKREEEAAVLRYVDQKSGKGARFWEQACITPGLVPKRLYTPVKKIRKHSAHVEVHP